MTWGGCPFLCSYRLAFRIDETTSRTMHTHTYAYILCVYIYICIYIYIFIYLSIEPVYLYIYIYTYIYMCTLYTSVYVYIYIIVYLQAHIHIHFMMRTFAGNPNQVDVFFFPFGSTNLMNIDENRLINHILTILTIY